MIQRVQSIYLLIAAVLTSITAALPVVTLTGNSLNGIARITPIAVDSTLPDLAGVHPWGITAALVLAVVLSLVAIFAYGNRRKQIRLVNLACTMNVLTLLATAFYAWNLSQSTASTPSPDVAILLPALSVIATLMARRGIRHDEALVRAADRIR